VYQGRVWFHPDVSISQPIKKKIKLTVQKELIASNKFFITPLYSTKGNFRLELVCKLAWSLSYDDSGELAARHEIGGQSAMRMAQAIN
jgi:hypothetical protein